MTKEKAARWNVLQDRLMALGIERGEVETLIRIERTLSNWSTAECNGEIQRDEEAENKPFRWWGMNGPGPGGCYRIADRERGALKRLGALMAKYPALWYYHQGDPRGCCLYVGAWKDLPSGDKLRPVAQERAELASYYSRGVAVCY